MRRRAANLGKHFSEHVHGMFLYPKATIKSVIHEQIDERDWTIPIFAVVMASFMTSIGAHVWFIAFEPSYLISFFKTLSFLVDFFLRPFWFLLVVWVPFSIIFHFLGSIVSGRDMSDTHTMFKTFKLFGLAMVPFFFNVIPYFILFTGYWVFLLAYMSMKENYNVTAGGAFVITLPYLVVLLLRSASSFGLL